MLRFELAERSYSGDMSSDDDGGGAGGNNGDLHGGCHRCGCH